MMLRMKKLLSNISKRSIQLGESEFATDFQKQNNWLGFDPATEKEIKITEQRLEISFPEDYKGFLRITNGFTAPNTIEPSFVRIEDVDYLKNIDPELIKIWASHEGLEEETYLLRESLLIGGLNEEQYFLLVPPNEKSDSWHYLKFAAWYPGIEEQSDLETYFRGVFDFIEKHK